MCYNTEIVGRNVPKCDEIPLGRVKIQEVLACLQSVWILAAIILMQSKRSAGLGAVSGNSSDTYWSKNKGNSVEGALERYTKIGGALFMILALIINLVG